MKYIASLEFICLLAFSVACSAQAERVAGPATPAASVAESPHTAQPPPAPAASPVDSACPPPTIKPPSVAHFQPLSGNGAIAYSNDGLRLIFPATQSSAVLHALTALGLDGVDRDFAWSPEGSRIAFLYTNLTPEPCASGYLMLANLETGEIRPLLAAPGRFGRPVWSPDGRQLALADQNARLNLVRVGDGTWHTLGNTAVAGITPAWLDNEHIVYARPSEPDGQVALVSQAIDGSEPRVILPQALTLSEFALSPDRQFLAYYNGALVLADLAKNEHHLGAEPFERLQWSPDGQSLLARSGERGLFLLRRAVPDRLMQLDLLAVPGLPAWSPDSRQLVVLIESDNNLPHIGIYDLTSGRLRELADQAQPPYDVAWSNR